MFYLDENNIRNSWDGNHNFVLMVFCLVPILIPYYTYGFVIYINQLYLNLHSSLNFWVFKSLLFIYLYIYLFILGRVQHIFLIALLSVYSQSDHLRESFFDRPRV